MATKPRRVQRRLLKDGKRQIPAVTFTQAIPDFLDYYKHRVCPGTLSDFSWAWKRLATVFGNTQISKITHSLVDQYKISRLDDGVKKRTINRELSYISTIIKWAEAKHIIEPTSFRVKKFRRSETVGQEPIVHTFKEISAIIYNLKPRHRGLVLLMYDAGLRKSEAMNLCGDQVDLDRELIRVFGKGSKVRVVPILTKRLFQELKTAKEKEGNDFLFPNPYNGKPYKDITQALNTASKRAGIDKKIYHHLLRHDHGTHTAMAGVDSRAIQRILGHASLTTTEIYTHLAGDYLRSEGKKFADMLEKKSESSTCSE